VCAYKEEPTIDEAVELESLTR